MQQLVQLWVVGDQLVLGAGQLVGEARDDGPGPQAKPPEKELSGHKEFKKRPAWAGEAVQLVREEDLVVCLG